MPLQVVRLRLVPWWVLRVNCRAEESRPRHLAQQRLAVHVRGFPEIDQLVELRQEIDGQTESQPRDKVLKLIGCRPHSAHSLSRLAEQPQKHIAETLLIRRQIPSLPARRVK